MVQQDQQCLGSARLQSRSPAQHSGLRIQRCRSCDLGHTGGLDLFPGPGTPYAVGRPKMKKKKRKKIGKKKKKKELILFV